MAECVYDKCCFCIDLRVGCFIMGYLSLISSVIETIYSFLLVGSSDTVERNAGVVARLPVVGIITLLAVAVHLVITIVLLFGLHKHKSGLLKAYLIYGAIFLLLSFILFIVTLVTGMWNVAYIAYWVFNLLLDTYILLVIRSYYYKMLEESGPPKYTC